MTTTTTPNDEALKDLQKQIRLAPGQFIATRIKRARKTCGYSHDQLGSLIGINRSHLIKLEKAEHRPKAPLLLRIAKETRREIDWFVDPEVDPSPFPDEAAAA